MSKQAIAAINAEIEEIKGVISNSSLAIAKLLKIVENHRQTIISMGEVIAQAGLDKFRQDMCDERNQPHRMTLLEGGEDYVMPKSDIIWLHYDNTRLMIEEVGGDLIVSAWKNDTEAEEPFSMMRVTTK